MNLRTSFIVTLFLSGIASADDAGAAFHSRIEPMLGTYCTKCHGSEKQKAKINIAGPRTSAQLAAERDVWFRVLDQIEAGNMPPEDEKQPTKAERDALRGWIRGEFTSLLVAGQRKEGRSKLRRLTRTEYANTVEDLFGVRPAIITNLPSDGRVDGYDKVSAALPMSAAGAEGYVKMAEAALYWVLKPIPKPHAPASPLSPDLDPARTSRSMALASQQSAGHLLELPDGITKVSFNTDVNSCPVKYQGTRYPGMHRMRISAYAYQTDKPIAFGIYAGHTLAYPQIIELRGVAEALPGKPTIVEANVYLHTQEANDLVSISDGIRLIPFNLGVPVPKNSLASHCKGPGLALQWIDVEEPPFPIGDAWATADLPEAMAQELRTNKQLRLTIPGAKAARGKIAVGRQDFLDAMEKTLKRVGSQFYRRDLTAAEISAIMEDAAKEVDAGTPFDAAFRDQFLAMMTSPDFLCLVEPAGKLSDFALATRLAFFLWNSTPDMTLLDLARKRRLHDPKVLAEQTERLLNDPKSARFVEDFTDQWLNLRAIDDTTPDSKIYPEYAKNDLLKRSSLLETRGFFRRILDQDLSVREFVAADWTLVNESLARQYGLPNITGIQMQQVKLPANSPFGGLWTQPAILKVTANGTYTSPVKRGRWVSERLLGIPIPPPPPDVPAVDPDTRGAKTLREQLSLHSSKGSCAGCHARFDPYGFALESFDVTGSFRTHYRILDVEATKLSPQERKGRPLWCDGLPVDASGKTPSGQTFAGIGELRKLLENNPEQLARGVTRHLISYSTGSQPTRVDEPAIDAIVKSSAGKNYGLRSLVHAIVQSELFQWK